MEQEIDKSVVDVVLSNEQVERLADNMGYTLTHVDCERIGNQDRWKCHLHYKPAQPQLTALAELTAMQKAHAAINNAMQVSRMKRAELLARHVTQGVMSLNEARAIVGYERLIGGDALLTPNDCA